jgi:hypothetical protein
MSPVLKVNFLLRSNLLFVIVDAQILLLPTHKFMTLPQKTKIDFYYFSLRHSPWSLVQSTHYTL